MIEFQVMVLTPVSVVTLTVSAQNRRQAMEEANEIVHEMILSVAHSYDWSSEKRERFLVHAVNVFKVIGVVEPGAVAA